MLHCLRIDMIVTGMADNIIAQLSLHIVLGSNDISQHLSVVLNPPSAVLVYNVSRLIMHDLCKLLHTATSVNKEDQR